MGMSSGFPECPRCGWVPSRCHCVHGPRGELVGFYNSDDGEMYAEPWNFGGGTRAERELGL